MRRKLVLVKFKSLSAMPLFKDVSLRQSIEVHEQISKEMV